MSSARRPSEADLRAAISDARFETYFTAAGDNGVLAVELYEWNARIAAALMMPAHLAEVTTRNAVSAALSAVYGAQWPWDEGFRYSLPSSGKYKPRGDLEKTRTLQPTTGKVIVELKFVFWESIFTARHDADIWDGHIKSVFPNADPAASTAELRFKIRGELETIRRLRNRLAHHEPIFDRNIADELERMLKLVELRSASTAQWVRDLEQVSSVLAEKPLLPIL
jgi:hypothetical protein